jgi:hypothetical protein
MTVLEKVSNNFTKFQEKMAKTKQLSEEEKLAFFHGIRDEYLRNIHRRFLELIVRAHQEVGSIDVKVSKSEDGTIIVTMYFQRSYESYGKTYYDVLTEKVSDKVPTSEEELNELEWNLDTMSVKIENVRRARIEMEQMQEKKSRALNKLTTEERKLLGLA